MAFTLCGMDLFADNRSHVFFGALTLVGALFGSPNTGKSHLRETKQKNGGNKNEKNCSCSVGGCRAYYNGKL